MVRAAGFCLILLPAPLFLGCSEAPVDPDEQAGELQWSDRQEEIHQLRELIRYEDETERQRQAELEALALPVDSTAAKPFMPARESQGQAQK